MHIAIGSCFIQPSCRTNAFPTTMIVGVGSDSCSHIDRNLIAIVGSYFGSRSCYNLQVIAYRITFIEL